MSAASKEPNNRIFWVLGGLMVLSLIGMAIGAAKLWGYDPSSAPRSALEGHAAPEISLPIVSGEGAEGHDRFSLSAMRGQVVLLDFWASWCVPCRRSIPILNQVHERYGDRIEMMGVNVENGLPEARIREAHREFGAEFPSLQDEAFAAQTAFGIESIPTLVLIDRQGVVRWVDRGVPDAREVAERVQEVLDEGP